MANATLPTEAMINSGDTAWMLVATGFVLLMTPGLAFFEAGLLRSRNILALIMQCWSGLCILSVLWYVVGFSLSFSGDNAFIGDLHFFFFDNVPTTVGLPVAQTIPGVLFGTFQMMFAAITPLLITGAFSERVSFDAFVVFVVIWSVVVYYPVCHWVWGGGWLAELGALDFAGGIVIHTTAGVSSLVVSIVLGPRTGFDEKCTSWATESQPHSIPLATIGASLLWMGWFGFNAGSALTSGAGSASTLLTTHIAGCTSGIVWALASKIEDGKPSLVASLNGVVAGLAGVTPAAGFINSQMGFCVGIVVGLASFFGVKLIKGKFKVDDALDVSSVHGITGVVGSLCVGLLASEPIAGFDGLFFGGGAAQLGHQAVAVLACGAWAGVWTYVVCKIVDCLCEGGLRVSVEEELVGLDASLHGELARVIDKREMSPPRAADADAALRAELKDLKISVLKKRASDAGVSAEALEEADDVQDVREAVVTLILDAQDGSGHEAWRTALSPRRDSRTGLSPARYADTRAAQVQVDVEGQATRELVMNANW